MSAAGRAAALGLRGRLPDVAGLASSPELKAAETLRLATGADRIRLDDRFGEVRRDEPYDDDFRERRLAWVCGRLDGRHAGWERPAEAAARFQAGIDGCGPDVLVCTHGMVLTAWLVDRGRLPAGHPAGEFWLGLSFPDVIPA